MEIGGADVEEMVWLESPPPHEARKKASGTHALRYAIIIKISSEYVVVRLSLPGNFIRYDLINQATTQCVDTGNLR